MTRMAPADSIRIDVRYDASKWNVSNIYWPHVPEKPQRIAAAMAIRPPREFFMF